MQLRRLALLCLLAGCTPTPEPASTSANGSAASGRPGAPDGSAVAPVPSPSPAAPGSAVAPVPSTRPAAPAGSTDAPVPSDPPGGALRQLHPHLVSVSPLTDGTLLVEPDYDVALARLDPATGALTPWTQGWRPVAAGWTLADAGTDSDDRVARMTVSPDGRWVACAHIFEPRPAPGIDDDELVATVVSRADGSEPRCVGVGLREAEGELPAFQWTADSRRLVGRWSGQCEPDARGRPVSFATGKELDALPRPSRWFEPEDGSRGEVPSVWLGGLRDPLGDVVVDSHHDRRRGSGLALYDLRTGTQLAAFFDDRGEDLFVGTFAAADVMLADVLTEGDERTLLGHRALHTDGRSVAAPGPGWRVYTRLPGGEVLFTRDGGASVEQGRVDWATFTVLSSRPRVDLRRFAGPLEDDRAAPTWKPGLGGVLILEPKRGPLYLAAI